MTRALVVLVGCLLGLAACEGEDDPPGRGGGVGTAGSGGSGGSGGGTLAVGGCRVEEGSDICNERAGTTKEVRCDNAGAREAASAAGCVIENKDDPGSGRVCCPESYNPQ